MIHAPRRQAPGRGEIVDPAGDRLPILRHGAHAITIGRAGTQATQGNVVLCGVGQVGCRVVPAIHIAAVIHPAVRIAIERPRHRGRGRPRRPDIWPDRDSRRPVGPPAGEEKVVITSSAGLPIEATKRLAANVEHVRVCRGNPPPFTATGSPAARPLPRPIRRVAGKVGTAIIAVETVKRVRRGMAGGVELPVQPHRNAIAVIALRGAPDVRPLGHPCRRDFYNESIRTAHAENAIEIAAEAGHVNVIACVPCKPPPLLCAGVSPYLAPLIAARRVKLA